MLVVEGKTENSEVGGEGQQEAVEGLEPQRVVVESDEIGEVVDIGGVEREVVVKLAFVDEGRAPKVVWSHGSSCQIVVEEGNDENVRPWESGHRQKQRCSMVGWEEALWMGERHSSKSDGLQPWSIARPLNSCGEMMAML